MIQRTVQLILERCLVRTRVYCVYKATPGQGAGRRDDRVCAYDATHLPSERVLDLLRCHAGRLGAWLMLRRLRRHGAILLTLMERDEMLGYGWLQSWRLADNATCVGPHWTHPDHRRKGLFGCLLAHSLHECHLRGWKELYVWAQESNIASRRGIEKAGFESLGRHRVSIYLFGAIRRHVLLGDDESPGIRQP